MVECRPADVDVLKVYSVVSPSYMPDRQRVRKGLGDPDPISPDGRCIRIGAHDPNLCNVTGLWTRFFGFDRRPATARILIHLRRLPVVDILTTEDLTRRSLSELTRRNSDGS